MNKERDSYYYTLGLRPGASLDEIELAFRRLAKLYHADHDHSLDAEMKHREIQAAYDELLNQSFVGKVDGETNPSRQTARYSEGVATRSFVEDRQKTEHAMWSKEEAMAHFYPSDNQITFIWLLTRFLFSLISFHLYNLARLVFVDYFLVIGILMSLTILGGVCFLVFNGVISKGLGTRITIFCPYFLSMWITNFIVIIQENSSILSLKTIVFYVFTVFFCYALLFTSTEDFFKRIED